MQNPSTDLSAWFQMKCRHRLMFISCSTRVPAPASLASYSQGPVPAQQCPDSCAAQLWLCWAGNCAWKPMGETMGGEEGWYLRQHPCQNKYTSIKYEGWYQSYQFALHRGYTRNTADFACITRSVCPTVTKLFQARNKYCNTNLNRSRGHVS